MTWSPFLSASCSLGKPPSRCFHSFSFSLSLSLYRNLFFFGLRIRLPPSPTKKGVEKFVHAPNVWLVCFRAHKSPRWEMLRFEGRSSHGYLFLPPFSFFSFPLMHSPSKLLQGPLPAPCLWAGSFARDDAYLHCIHFKQGDTPSLFPRLWKPVDSPPSHSPP